MSTGGRYREKAGVRRAAAVMYDSAAWIGLLSTNGTPPKVTVRREKHGKIDGVSKNHGCEDKCKRFSIFLVGNTGVMTKKTGCKTQYQNVLSSALAHQQTG